jgi:hypothetical protein
MDMWLDQEALAGVDYPGVAGALQRQGARDALVVELGTNYSTYHAYLKQELEKIGHRPTPTEFPYAQAYYRAWQRVHHLVLAEAVLRNCRAYVRAGEPLDAIPDPGVPLVRDDRLVSVEDEPDAWHWNGHGYEPPSPR